MNDPRPLMSIARLYPAEVATRLRVSRATVYRLVATGELLAFRAGASLMIGVVPAGLVAVLIDGDEQYRGLRMRDEPPFPGEWHDGGVAWYERGQWVPCPVPRCGRALVWYEAGYVPGYRICTRGHHAQLSRDGRSARPIK